MWKPGDVEESVDELPFGRVFLEAHELKQPPWQARHLHRIERREQPFLNLDAATGVTRHQLFAAFAQIRQYGFFQRPAHTQIAHEPARHFGNPIESCENQFGHWASPSCGAEL